MLKKTIITSFLLLSACSQHRFAEFGIISPEITNLTTAQLEKAKIKTGVVGSDSRKVYFLFPDGYPSLENAVQNALIKHDADILVNAKAEYSGQWFFFFGSNTITVTGDAVSLAPMIEGDFFQ